MSWSPIIVIGRGHSGTRAIAQLLEASGIFMGAPLNPSHDYQGGGGMYHFARACGTYAGGESGKWDFSGMIQGEIPVEARSNLAKFLQPLLDSGRSPVGWKLPETNLAYPWLVRLYPEARFIHWVRDPRDNILTTHGTDELGSWGLQSSSYVDPIKRRAESWCYHFDIVEQTPRPARFLRVRIEDWIADHAAVESQLSELIGLRIQGVKPKPTEGRWRGNHAWKAAEGRLKPYLQRLGYTSEKL